MRAIQLYNGYKVSCKLLKEEWLSWYVAYLCNIKYLSEVACKSLILKKLHVASFTLLLAKAIVCVCKQILQFFAYSSKHQNIWHFTFDILYLYKFSNYLSHFQNCKPLNVFQSCCKSLMLVRHKWRQKLEHFSATFRHQIHHLQLKLFYFLITSSCRQHQSWIPFSTENQISNPYPSGPKTVFFQNVSWFLDINSIMIMGLAPPKSCFLLSVVSTFLLSCTITRYTYTLPSHSGNMYTFYGYRDILDRLLLPQLES